MNINSLIKSVAIYGCFIGAGYYIHQNAVPGEISWKIAGIILTVAWIARVAYNLTASYRKAKKKVGTLSIRNIDAATTATMPDWMLGYYSTEKKIYRFAWRALTFARVDGQDGFAAPVPRAKAVVAMVLAVAAVAAGAWAASALLAWLGTGSSGIVGAVVTVLLGVYLAVWILGDWRATVEGRHRIGADALELNIGVRAAVSIPLDAIARCTAVAGASGLPADPAGGKVLSLSAGRPTDVVLELNSPLELAVSRFGYPVPVRTERIAVSVADAQEFTAALARRLDAAAAPVPHHA